MSWVSRSLRDVLAAGRRNQRGSRCGVLERMPTWLICIPLVLQWLGLALRYRCATLPSAANPHITAGGLVGEGKLEYFLGMGRLAKAATADYCAISTRVLPSSAELQQLLAATGLSYPVIAKPDLGLCGHGVRLVLDEGELRAYLVAFPSGETVVIQRYLPHEGEAGIFYVRDPDTDRGRIIGLTLRYFPYVVGDGCRTLAMLVDADPRARRLLRSPRHECRLAGARIPAVGEKVRLATIGSTRVGGLYRDGGRHITPQLTAAIDAIARDMPAFHFGRFDVRFESLATLQDGNGFVIMEINGAGAEAIHAWDPDLSLHSSFRQIFAKQRILFAIGHAQRRRGVQPISLARLVRLHLLQRRLIATYPPSN